ncbi:inovirus Gp2 family protein [Oceanisphaera ostreae]|uniref:Inovirus Gp2 family protein n=1 Tax=Oceanisphaera ostreae TaxID=914151 RepID=A0ABW3KLJ5_9GAMM
MTHLINHRGPLVEAYLKGINKVIDNALREHARTIAIRVDLRLPDKSGYSPSHLADLDHKVISRFFASIKSQVASNIKKRRNAGARVHPCTLRYIWVREFNKDHKEHYHVLLLLNKDTYLFFGSYESDKNAIVNMTRKAWASALGVDVKLSRYLVHIPKNPFYILDVNDESFSSVYSDLLYRASYFAKLESKDCSDGNRSFGCSQR